MNGRLVGTKVKIDPDEIKWFEEKMRLMQSFDQAIEFAKKHPLFEVALRRELCSSST